MGDLSVIVNGVSDNEKFYKKLFAELGSELAVDVNDNTITFHNLCEKNVGRFRNILAKSIVSEFQKKILVRAVNKNCDGFDKSDKIEIWKISMRQLLEDEFSNNTDYNDRIRIVENGLKKCFDESDVISLEGFVNFRMSDYTDELSDVIDMSVQEYMIELEYKEFVKMLKYFLSVQSSRYLSVDVIYGNEILIYGDGKDVTDECVAEYISEISDGIENREDFVLNSLIIMAPRKVRFHIQGIAPDKELADTLKNVFGERIVFINKNENVKSDMLR